MQMAYGYSSGSTLCDSSNLEISGLCPDPDYVYMYQDDKTSFHKTVTETVSFTCVPCVVILGRKQHYVVAYFKHICI